MYHDDIYHDVSLEKKDLFKLFKVAVVKKIKHFSQQ